MSESASHPSKESPRKNELWEWTKALLLAVALAMLIRTFLFASFLVDGRSMLPNLQDEERLVVNKIIYHLREPKRGEIVVFHATPEKDYIKRVIALPGETVEVMDDTLYINGKKQQEPYLRDVEAAYHKERLHYTFNFGPVKVPEDHVFVMGDNRPNSEDSREFGPVPLDVVVGRAEVVFWPLPNIRWLHGWGDGN